MGVYHQEMSILDFIKSDPSLEEFLGEHSFDWIRRKEDRPAASFFQNEQEVLFHSGNLQVSGIGITRVASVRFQGRAHLGDNGFMEITRFAVVSEGEALLLTRKNMMHLKPGMFFSRMEGEANTLIVISPDAFRIKVVSCRGKRAPALHRELLGEHSVAFMPLHPDQIRSAFGQIITDAREQTEQSHHIAACQLEILLRRLQPHAAGHSSSTHPQAYHTFMKCRQYIHQHAPALVSVEEIASACSVDPSYLGRLFKRFEKISPYQYLMQIKMNYAGGLLLNTHFPVQEIAEQMGYSDPFNFSRAFKRIQGRSPQQYRKDR